MVYPRVRQHLAKIKAFRAWVLDEMAAEPDYSSLSVPRRI